MFSCFFRFVELIFLAEGEARKEHAVLGGGATAYSEGKQNSATNWRSS
jgi:hypothetical protein